MNRRAIIEVAIKAATDREYDDYFSDEALDYLRDIDPEYDWDYELFQAELENGKREMGPVPPRVPGTGISLDQATAALKAVFLPSVLERLEAESAFLKYLKKE